MLHFDRLTMHTKDQFHNVLLTFIEIVIDVDLKKCTTISIVLFGNSTDVCYMYNYTCLPYKVLSLTQKGTEYKIISITLHLLEKKIMRRHLSTTVKNCILLELL